MPRSWRARSPTTPIRTIPSSRTRRDPAAQRAEQRYIRVDWYMPDRLPTRGDGRCTILGTHGYIEVRKYVDIAGREGTTTCSWSTTRRPATSITMHVVLDRARDRTGPALCAVARVRAGSAEPRRSRILAWVNRAAPPKPGLADKNRALPDHGASVQAPCRGDLPPGGPEGAGHREPAPGPPGPQHDPGLLRPGTDPDRHCALPRGPDQTAGGRATAARRSRKPGGKPA
jgi:hypothetical protein